MKNLFAIFIISFFGLQLLFSQMQKGDRTLAWQVDMTENNNYDSAFSYAKEGCMESVHLFYKWSDIEPDKDTFNPNIINAFDIINIYYPLNNTKVELQLAVINTVDKETPNDLLSEDFKTQPMIDRFKIVLDTLFSHIPNVNLAALNIGNESDIFLGTDSLSYVDFKVFLDSVVPYAKQKYFNLYSKNLKVGTTLTFDGLTKEETKDYCKMINDSLDIVSVTYYPLNGDFTMKDPSVVFDDFDSIVKIYSDTSQPVYFVECGYATSAFCNSSEEKQSQFFTNVFSAWDSHYDNIKYLTIFKSTDWSKTTVNQLGEYYGIADTVFKEYLRTLGVRTYSGNGTDKKAYNTILCELSDRGWCAVDCNNTDIESFNVESGISIIPNPASDFIYVDTDENISKVLIYNIKAELVKVSNKKEISVSDLKKGTYFVKIETKSGKVLVRKFLKD
jgi:hypothetical protein